MLTRTNSYAMLTQQIMSVMGEEKDGPIALSLKHHGYPGLLDLFIMSQDDLDALDYPDPVSTVDPKPLLPLQRGKRIRWGDLEPFWNCGDLQHCICKQSCQSILESQLRNGHLQQRLPNTLSISFRGQEANRILGDIGLEVAASAGAACHSDTVQISHVLKAMGVPLEWAKGTLRFSVGRMTTEAEIDKAIRVMVEALNQSNCT